MPGRHQLTPSKRPKLRWLAGGAGAAIVGATALLAALPGVADASGDPVTATFSVTGVSTSGCPVSAGGSDVYVKPGQELDVKSSLTGIQLLGLNLSLGSYRGQLIVDPSASKPIKLMTDSKATPLPALATGDHKFDWTVTDVAGVPLPASLVSLSAGAKLHYSGTIHVTSAKTKCGVAIQLPSVAASASAPGLPPVNIGVPGVKITPVPNLPSLPNLPGLPKLPGLGGSSSAANPGAGNSTVGNELPVPARVVPSGDGNAVFGNVGGGYQSGVLPGLQNQAGGSGGGRVQLAPLAGKASSSPVVKQDSTGKNKTIDLAASKENSTGQFSVILAIIAVIALSVVAATYARLYLLRRGT